MTNTLTPADAIVDAEASLTAAHKAMETATDHAEALRDRLRTGDATVTTKAMVDADAAIERTTLLHGASVRALARIKLRQTPPSDLADALKDVLAKVLRVPVSVVTVIPTDAPTILPVAYIVAARDMKADRINGSLSGTVNVSFIRSDLHAVPSADGIERKLVDAGYNVEVNFRGTATGSDGIETDSYRLLSRATFPAMPVLEGSPTQLFRYSNLSRMIGSGLSNNTRMDGRPQVATSGSAVVQESDKVDADGIRTRVFTGIASAWPIGSGTPYSDGDTLSGLLKSQILNTKGQALSGLGRVSEASIGDSGPIKGARGGRALSFRFAVQSRVA